ncbi:MAG: hypothetical protein WB341_17460 [Terracidiphilus sp.]
MQFLSAPANPQKILRTRLYGDQRFSHFELELLHTPILQRLYGLKQLGFADRVFPDAIHSRINHIIGAAEMADRMAQSLAEWLDSHKSQTFKFKDSNGKEIISISGEELHELVASRRSCLRLMAILHDITHSAFGHTLEDEVNVFREKHDDPNRQTRFFNGLVAQLIYLWVSEKRIQVFDGSTLEQLSSLEFSDGMKREISWAQELAAGLTAQETKTLATNLRDLEIAFRLLLRIDFAHAHNQTEPTAEELLVSKAIETLDPNAKPARFVLHRDLFLIDLVGNTICADLLDYAQRDADQAGLRIQFDTRFLRYLCVVSVEGELSPTRQPAIRSAIQIFTNKMRHDVLSEISGILKARYLINERVLYHPTKCAAGAMLGTAIQLLGLRDLPIWMQVLGDIEFVATLIRLAAGAEQMCGRLDPNTLAGNTQPWPDVVRAAWPVEPKMAELVSTVFQGIHPDITPSTSLATHHLDKVRLNVRGARNVLWKLNSRHFPKLAYRLGSAHHTGGDSDETIAEKYSGPEERFELERRIERICNLPIGSTFVHCPRHKTSIKVAEALVVGSNLEKAAQLRDVIEISPDGLQPYQSEIRAIEEMYKSIWHLHAFLDPTFWDKQPIVAQAFERALKFPNDQLLAEELSKENSGIYALMAGEMRDDIAPNLLPRVVERIDDELRMRRGKKAEKDRDRLRRIVREVGAEDSDSTRNQMDLPGLEKEP